MLTNTTADTLSQLRYIIDQLTKDEYTFKLPVLNHYSIGQHVRHVLEFYICLSQGIESGTVDYDRRARNPAIENDPNYAIVILDELLGRFCQGSINDTTLANTIEFNGVSISTNSSLGRELVYLIEHSIHHFAIIAIALRNQFSHIEIPPNFGVAHSTFKHKEKEAVDYNHQH